MSSADVAGTAEWRSESGALLLGHCRTCDSPHYYPRQVCPFCFGADVGRIEAKGSGQVYSYSHTLRGPAGPYILAYVTLDEGVTMLTNLVDVDPADVAINMSVTLEFRDLGGTLAPVFCPA
jgi:uncharacterized OB-fold protein